MSMDTPAVSGQRQVIEEHSYDFVPTEERHGKSGSLFYVWFGASAHVVCVVTGAIAIGLGLPFWWAVIAIVLGNLVGALFMASHSAQGPRLGLPQVIQSRAQFGYQGVLLISLLVWAAYIGWAAFDILLAGEGFQGIAGGNLTLWLIPMAAALLLLAVFGYDWIHRFMAYQTWVYIGVFLIITGVLIFHGFPAGSLTRGHFSLSQFMLAVSIFAVWQISYAPYVSDYSRYLPAKKAYSTFWYTYWGTCIASIWLMALGAGIAALAPSLAPLDEVKALGGSFWGPVLVLVIAFGLLPPSAMNIYGGIVTSLTIGDSVKHFRSTAGLRFAVGLVVAVLSLLVASVGSGNFMNSFENYLTLLLYFLVPWTAINLTDFYLIRRGIYRTEDFFNPHGPFGTFSWRGLVVYFVAFAIEIPFMNTAVYKGPLSNAMGGADITWIVGLVVAIPLYYFLAKQPHQTTPPLADPAKSLEPSDGPID